MVGACRQNGRYPSTKNGSLFNAKPEGRRGVGRPRLRWLDDVEADIKDLGVRRWRIKAQDRKEWSAIVREAKAKRKGPCSQRSRSNSCDICFEAKPNNQPT
jgi:hypothetical protein